MSSTSGRSRAPFLLAFVVGLGLGCGAWLLRPSAKTEPSAPPTTPPEPPSPTGQQDTSPPELRAARRPPGARGVTDLALLAGTVVDAQGQAIAGAVLDIPTGDHPGAVLSDAKGRFLLPLRGARSPLALRVRAPGYLEQLVEGLAPAATDLRIVLEPGYAIHGKVVDPQGKPVAGARVTLGEGSRDVLPTKAAPGSPIETARLDAAGSRVTGPDGSFALEDLPGVVHRLFATAPGFARSRGESVAAPSTDVTLVLEPGYVLEVRVHDTAGNPVPGAWVTSEARDPPYPSVAGLTDETGTLRVDGLPPVRRTLGVMAAGFARALVEDVRFGGPPVNVRLEPERRLRLRVTGSDGKLARPDLIVLDTHWDYVWHHVLETEDGIEITGLGEGPYTLVLSGPEVVRTVLPQVTHRDSPITVAMKPGLRIRGTLPLADAGEYVYAIPRGAQPPPPSRHPLRAWVRPEWVETGAVTFEIPGLEDRAYDLLVVVGRGAEGVSDLPPAWGGTVISGVVPAGPPLEIALPKGESIVGVVRRAGQPATDLAEVQAYDERGLCRAFCWPTGEKGGFALRGLPAGRYRLVVWLDNAMVSLDDVAAPSEDVVVEVP